MWLINSSIGRKVVMSVTGIALVLFLTFHASMNVVALISAKGYNMICEFLGANWYAVVATVGLAGLVALHFIYAIWLTLQNQKARGNSKYAVTDKPAAVEWASQNMLVLGLIVVLGMALHLYNFWWNMMAAELIQGEEAVNAANGVYWIAETFKSPVYTGIYLVWLVALWFHLTHGFWSALQTLGWSGHVWFKRWRCIGNAYVTIVVLMFAAVAVAFWAGYRPADCACQQAEQVIECPMMHGQCHREGQCHQAEACPMAAGCHEGEGQCCGQCQEKATECCGACEAEAE